MLRCIDFKIPSRKLLGVFSLLLVAGALPATTITFSELPATNDNCCYLTTEYAYLGLTFADNDGSIWGGKHNPGNWGRKGTNTPAFLGFNDIGPADGYSASLVFSSPISDFSLDVARARGSSRSDTFTLEAFDSASVLLFSETVSLRKVNRWKTITASVDDISRIDIAGHGEDFHPFGIDNLQWTSAPAVPEPSSMAFIATGLIALGFSRRRS